MMNESIRVLLIDDCELVRYGLRYMLELEEDVKVVGDYSGTKEAIPEMSRLSPDIVLMEAETPGMNLTEAIHSLKGNGLNHDCSVIILADSMNYQAEALEAGASGYLLKDITRAEFVQAILESYRSKRPSRKAENFTEEVVELDIPPPANDSWLLRFICQLEERLRREHACIRQTIISRDRSAIIVVSSKPATLYRLFDELDNISKVEEVEEESLEIDEFSGCRKKLWPLPNLSVEACKRFRITLKEGSMTKQQPVAALN